jgi:signal transduction histidine kinase
MVLIGFFVGWFLSGLTLRPIDKMTQTAKEIGENRDFNRRVEYSGKQDEVGRLAMTFNQMLGQLQDAFKKVEHSLQQQQNFVADVSHELRTPMTTLRGNLGLLLKKPPAPAEIQEDILTDMVDESDRMIRLVNDLLLMAHADAGRSLMKERIEVPPILEHAVHQARQLANQREINLELSEGLAIMGDKDALKQILLILLDNSLKYSNDSINVISSRKGARIKIQVQDYGEGIASDDLEHVFDRFYRSEDNAFLPGFGLGLSIAKALVEAMGGEIGIESELGKGTNVLLSFPVLE